MTVRRLLLGGAAAALTAAALLLGGVLSGGSSKGAGAVPLASGLAETDTALLPRLQAQLRAKPRDAHGLALLGLAYQQRARETGDPTYYTKSDGVLRRALHYAPNDLLSTTGLGALALSRHRFRDALVLGRRAVALSPTTARGYGVLGDALLELGRYRQAFETFDRMVSLKPSLSSYARISYARELIGDVRGAATAMRLAIDAAVGQPEALAWSHTQLGKLFWSQGHIAAAAREYRNALAVRHGYVYALDGLAQVEAARGRLRAGIAAEQRAVDGIPLPQFVATLGDLYRLAGDRTVARRQYALIGAIQRLLRANGVKTDLETALFDVDHAIRLPQALRLARAARAARPSIDGDDVLAWALTREGRCSEALPYAERALRLGTRDATKLFHRGMIELCLGHGEDAKQWFRRALALNPHFSILWAPVARRFAA
ncbi:MAG: tetratricopeptide repeat protein [Actinobacteria bacterium]|nr:MAG: tetratricopeptide repeat protein [Actinomycetota bacterium]